MDFGFKINESNGCLMLNFKHHIQNWKRYTSEIIRDRVIIDTRNAEKSLKENGDEIVYEVYNLWAGIEKFKIILEKEKIECDITYLNSGIFSTSNKGELYSTYGHVHEKNYGEAFTVLKNDCSIILSDRKTNETFIVSLREGDSIFVHPKFMHRITSSKNDSIIVNFLSKDTGHDYSVIKNKGFPFHLFYDEAKKKIEVKKNVNYKKSSYKIIKKFRANIDPIRLLERNPKKLRDILENPEKYKEIYSIK